MSLYPASAHPDAVTSGCPRTRTPRHRDASRRRPGLGRATTSRFGHEGFDVALISRSREHLAERTAALSADGVNACGYVADGRDGDFRTFVEPMDA